MNATDRDLVYVYVDCWEYQCCRSAPEVGARIAGSVQLYRVPGLTAFPTPRGGTPVPELGLVRWRGFAASTPPGRQDDDDSTVPDLLHLSWHSDDLALVSIEAEIADIHEYNVRYTVRTGPDGRRVREIVPDTQTLSTVPTATVWPPNPRSSTEPEIDGVIVGLRDITITEPSHEVVARDRAARAAAAERKHRILRLAGPLYAFGPTRPRIGESLTVDLADPRLDKRGNLSECTDVVRGQVRVVIPFGDEMPTGWVAYTPITEPDPPLPNLLVTLEIEQPHTAADTPRNPQTS
ncbi:DUF6578 domain-containing protein [Tsukamurella soli]|uniref:DUF6578 domain-containing protein n=1 Tax=Tsukamurella soli TaxID=644556 RepID=UPI0031F15A50